MIPSPHYSSHAEQQAMLGCAANLDPTKYPRRYAQQQARIKHAKECRKPLNQTHTILDARRQYAEQQAAERYELAERAQWYSDMSLMDAADALGVSHHRLAKVKSEFGLVFNGRASRKHLEA